ncbi:hypothetical protein K402DRAFT_164425 [Aulographum hederae CBS 113979]|uniref:Uncharacterized protein n=1 Tax=Aulographum hederae CBS 113979 TaxID=1176131 RepID=A0A6G1GRK2_9PEZI|nr:hypothetical protein K402DRAFT_164425 [Aulographum hederae CBS 113979]
MWRSCADVAEWLCSCGAVASWISKNIPGSEGRPPGPRIKHLDEGPYSRLKLGIGSDKRRDFVYIGVFLSELLYLKTRSGPGIGWESTYCRERDMRGWLTSCCVLSVWLVGLWIRPLVSPQLVEKL